jgi:hypothetical protein
MPQRPRVKRYDLANKNQLYRSLQARFKGLDGIDEGAEPFPFFKSPEKHHWHLVRVHLG